VTGCRNAAAVVVAIRCPGCVHPLDGRKRLFEILFDDSRNRNCTIPRRDHLKKPSALSHLLGVLGD
jgi:hypothetical protein